MQLIVSALKRAAQSGGPLRNDEREEATSMKNATLIAAIGASIGMSTAFTGNGAHWTYQGHPGAAHWTELDQNFLTC